MKYVENGGRLLRFICEDTMTLRYVSRNDLRTQTYLRLSLAEIHLRALRMLSVFEGGWGGVHPLHPPPRSAPGYWDEKGVRELARTHIRVIF